MSKVFLPCQITCVHRQGDAGQVTGFVGGQPEDGGADGFRRQQVAIRKEIEQVHDFQKVFVGGLGAGATGEEVVERLVAAHDRIYAGRADGIDVDVVGRQFKGQRL